MSPKVILMADPACEHRRYALPMWTNTRLAAIGAAILIVLSTSACWPTDPGGPPSGPTSVSTGSVDSPIPTNSPAKAGRVDTLRLESKQLDLLGDGSSVSVLSMTSITRTVEQLTSLLGAPTVAKTKADNQCTAEHTTYNWQDAVRLTDEITPQSDTVPDYEVRLLKATATAADGSIITLDARATGSVKVGSDIKALISSAAAVNKQSYVDAAGATHWTLLLESGWTSTHDPHRGLVAFTDGTVVTALGSPVAVNSNDDC